MADDSLNPTPLTTDFLRAIADVSSEETAHYAYASSVILPETGWPPEEFTDRLLLDLAHVRNQRIFEQARTKALAGTYAPFTFSLTANNGNKVRFQACPRPGVAANGSAMTVVTLAPLPPTPKDAFETNDDIFRILEVFPAYVLLIDRDYTVRFANRTARQFFGKGNGKKCHELLHGRSSPCVTCPPFGLLTDKAIKVHEWASPSLNTAFRAHSYPFEFKDGTTHILQIGLNITAGVRARHALDLSEQRYRSIAENLTMGLALVDPKRNLITLNPRMEEWFGERAVRGAVIDDLLQHKCCGRPEDGETCVFQSVLADRKTGEKEFRLVLPSGEERIFRLVACPILTRMRQVRAIVIMLEDVTDRRTLASRMQQMQRLEALGSLAGGIAHEINQPLSALHLYASGMQMLLEQGSTTPEQVLKRLSLILAQAEKIRQIIGHMRTLVMQEENPPCSAVQIRNAVNDALGLVGAQLRDHAITVSLDIPEILPPVAASTVQLEQVVINLLVNAMHALDSVPPEQAKKKTIHLAADRDPTDETFLLLRVSDNGPGVGALHSRIFDPFFTTKEPQQGMGLGLSIVHAFVSSWGGSAEAADNPDGPGATFTVRLPVYAADALSSETMPRP